MKSLEEITIEFNDGHGIIRKTYIPDIEAARKAPALICAVASRTLRLRNKLNDLKEKQESLSPDEKGQKILKLTLKEIEDILSDYVNILPFENELISGKIEQVNHAIENS